MPRRWPDSLEQAACRALPPQVFDAKTRADAEAALLCCRGCPVVRACEDWMRPRRVFYDGVVAGKLWRDGRPVTVAVTIESHLTVSEGVVDAD